MDTQVEGIGFPGCHFTKCAEKKKWHWHCGFCKKMVYYSIAFLERGVWVNKKLGCDECKEKNGKRVKDEIFGNCGLIKCPKKKKPHWHCRFCKKIVCKWFDGKRVNCNKCAAEKTATQKLNRVKKLIRFEIEKNRGNLNIIDNMKEKANIFRSRTFHGSTDDIKMIIDNHFDKTKLLPLISVNGAGYIDLNKTRKRYEFDHEDYIVKLNKKENQTIVVFGEHKGKTFEYVYSNNISYSNWILDKYLQNVSLNKNLSTNFNIFGKYVQKRNFERDSEQISGPINVVALVDKIKYNDIFEELIGKHQIKINRALNKKTYLKPKNLPGSTYGTFLDFFIRHYLGSKKLIKNVDDRANFITNDKILYNHSYNGKLKEYFDKKGIQFSQLMEDGRKIIKNSYKEYINNNNTKKIAEHIFNTSLCHGISFSKKEYEHLGKYTDNFMSDVMYNDISFYLDKYCSGKCKIQLNPSLGNSKILGDADLIIKDDGKIILIDIKCYAQDFGNNIKDFYQLFVYAALYKKRFNLHIDTLLIYNPLLGHECTITVNKNMLYERIYTYINNIVVIKSKIENKAVIPETMIKKSLTLKEPTVKKQPTPKNTIRKVSLINKYKKSKTSLNLKSKIRDDLDTYICLF